MGHHSASCALSGLPLFDPAPVIVVSLTGSIDTYDYWGTTYSILQHLKENVKRRKSNKEMQEMYQDLLNSADDCLGEECKEKYAQVINIFKRDVSSPFRIFRGKYSGYGDIEDSEMDREHHCMFFHPKVWAFAQEHWKEQGCILREFQTQEEFEFENVCALAMWLRIALTWSPGHLGCQDPEKEEFELRDNFLSLLQKTNKEQQTRYILSEEE
jgi:hypothetical protein